VLAAEPLPTDARIAVGFSPGGGAEAIILAGIEQARESIQVAASSFTSRAISRALLDARKRGVDVRVIADKEWNSENTYSAVNFLANQGIPVRVNGNYAIFHHKFMIIDGRHVQTGSFNYSAAAANKNVENVLLLWDVQRVAELYDREWQRLWAESVEVKARY
jgi:phosphatidylserine/phosphatidylglycerophosphate/cardiolipin synthase-like enzyme